MKAKSIVLASASVALVGLVTSADAGVRSYDGTGGPIDIVGDHIFTIDVADAGIIDSFVSVELDIFHSWVGDLTVTLASPGGTSVTLIDRPGVPTSTFGDSSNLDGVYTFSDGLGSIDAGQPYGGLVPTGDYGPAVGSLSSFEGEEKEGTWTLTINDGAGGDTGTLTSWAFSVINVPAPGALALLGLAGFVGTRRRR